MKETGKKTTLPRGFLPHQSFCPSVQILRTSVSWIAQTSGSNSVTKDVGQDRKTLPSSGGQLRCWRTDTPSHPRWWQHSLPKMLWGGWRTWPQGWSRSSVPGPWRRAWGLIILPQKCAFMLLNCCNSISGSSIEAIFPLLLSLSLKITMVKGAIRTSGGVISTSLKSATTSLNEALKKTSWLETDVKEIQWI